MDGLSCWEVFDKLFATSANVPTAVDNNELACSLILSFVFAEQLTNGQAHRSA